jgi:hypothetical protein
MIVTILFSIYSTMLTSLKSADSKASIACNQYNEQVAAKNWALFMGFGDTLNTVENQFVNEMFLLMKCDLMEVAERPPAEPPD